jgi:hypothetical protein
VETTAEFRYTLRVAGVDPALFPTGGKTVIHPPAVTYETLYTDTGTAVVVVEVIETADGVVVTVPPV